MSDAAVTILKAERARKAQELEGMMAVARELKAAIRSIDEAIEVLDGRSEAAPEAVRSRGATGTLKAIIIEILTETPGLGPTAIADALQSRGKPTDVNTVLGTLSRAKRDGLIHKKDRVWFVGESMGSDVSIKRDGAPDVSEALSSIGSVAKLYAPDLESDGSSPEQAASVGSNPTTSAPIAKSLLGSASALGVHRTPQTPPWLKR